MTVETRIGKITASKDVLNEISMLFANEAKRYEERNLLSLSRRYLISSKDILEALEAIGYYDDVK